MSWRLKYPHFLEERQEAYYFGHGLHFYTGYKPTNTLEFPADWWVESTARCLQNKVKHAASSIFVSTRPQLNGYRRDTYPTSLLVYWSVHALVVSGPEIVERRTYTRESWVRFPDKEIRNAIVPILGDWRGYAWTSFINSFSQDYDIFPMSSIVSHRGFPCLTLLWSCLRCRSVTSLLVHWSVHAASMTWSGCTRENWVQFPDREWSQLAPFYI